MPQRDLLLQQLECNYIISSNTLRLQIETRGTHFFCQSSFEYTGKN